MNTNKVSILDFRKNLYKLISTLQKAPLEVQAKGKTLFYVVQLLPPSGTHENGTMPVDTGENKIGASKLSNKGYWNDIEGVGQVSRGWCELHFEKGVEYDRVLITWEDENGVPIIKDKWACPKCVEKYESMGRGRVYYL